MGLLLSLLPCGCWDKKVLAILFGSPLVLLTEGPGSWAVAVWRQPLSSRTVLLGLPRSSLTTSRIDDLSECAGNMNRLLHVLVTWPVRVHPLAGPQAQVQGP